MMRMKPSDANSSLICKSDKNSRSISWPSAEKRSMTMGVIRAPRVKISFVHRQPDASATMTDFEAILLVASLQRGLILFTMIFTKWAMQEHKTSGTSTVEQIIGIATKLIEIWANVLGTSRRFRNFNRM